MYKFVDKKEIAKLLGVKPDSVSRYREKWTEGIHYYRDGSSQVSRYFYNFSLIQHWANEGFRDVESLSHIQEIRNYLQSTKGGKNAKKSA